MYSNSARWNTLKDIKMETNNWQEARDHWVIRKSWEGGWIELRLYASNLNLCYIEVASEQDWPNITSCRHFKMTSIDEAKKFAEKQAKEAILSEIGAQRKRLNNISKFAKRLK